MKKKEFNKVNNEKYNLDEEKIEMIDYDNALDYDNETVTEEERYQKEIKSLIK